VEKEIKADQEPRSRKAYRQLGLFSDIVSLAALEAIDSPKGAFYKIWIEANAGRFTVIKESGAKGRVLDKRAYPTKP
jgi:hypothetical protein